MRSIPVSIAAAGLALALSAGASAAQANCYCSPARHAYYRPAGHYVTRRVVVRERVWRPVARRVHYRRVYAAPYYSYAAYEPAYGYSYPTAYSYDEPVYSYAYGYPVYGDGYGWEHRRWDHGRWGHGGWRHEHRDHDRD
jgi:hypothetical protein